MFHSTSFRRMGPYRSRTDRRCRVARSADWTLCWLTAGWLTASWLTAGWLTAGWLTAARADSPATSKPPGAATPGAEGKASSLAHSPSDAPPASTSEARSYSVTELTQLVRSSLVSISLTGRDGGDEGLGTGFVVSAEGLIASNLHVIGEGHRFTVELADGTKLKAKAIHAWEPSMDLVVIRVDPAGKTLTPLPLGDSAAAEQGTAVVAMGNPQGLKHSVVAGLVSARRQIEGRDMLQLAMPIEPGNSGGPVVDMRGHVLGLVNMKSTVNENLGFAVEVNALKRLLASPNPIPIERWMTIGRVDSRRWLPLFGADWRQRSGRILVSGLGEGFGGRSLCLSRQSAPELPFEVAVQVKLDDESGAAGLVFHADGADRHYGFYPSGGQLRLTCFDGPSVLQWQILRETPSTFYRPGDWNWLKVRVEKDRFACFVNDHLVCESADDTFAQGQVGLAKFRDTRAEFRQFQIAKSIEASAAGSDTVQSAVRALTDSAQIAPSRIADLARSGSEAVQAIRHEARELQRRSAELIRVARDVHIAQVCEELARLGAVPDSDMDTLRAALWIAKLDEEDIDVESYVQAVEAMAAEIAAALPRPPAEAAEGKQPAEPAAEVPAGAGADRARLAALNDYLFRQNGFHGLRFDYYHRANSYLNRVIDDRAGLPITLSVLYIELGRRLRLQVEGVGVPSHFIVRVRLRDGEPQLVDVFDGGKELSRHDVEQLVRERANVQLTDDHLAASSGRSILQRMLNNLRGAAAGDPEALRTYTEAMVVLSPDSVEERLKRALLRAETKRLAASLDDLDWILARSPPGINLDAVHAFRDKVQRQIDLAP